MSVLIRKLSNRRNIEFIHNSCLVDDIQADVVAEEFRTKGNKLSVWETDADEVDIGILAISLSSSRIETMDFIIMDKDIVENNSLCIMESKPEINPLKQADSIHRDISNLRLQDFQKLAKVYKEASKDEAGVIRYTAPKLRKIIKNALDRGWIDSANANGRIKETIEELLGV